MDRYEKMYQELEKNIEVIPVYISKEEYSKKQARLCQVLLEIHELMYGEKNCQQEAS